MYFVNFGYTAFYKGGLFFILDIARVVVDMLLASEQAVWHSDSPFSHHIQFQNY